MAAWRSCVDTTENSINSKISFQYYHMEQKENNLHYRLLNFHFILQEFHQI